MTAEGPGRTDAHAAAQVDNSAWVDPFIGTEATELPERHGLAATWWWPKPQVGNTHPGATYPLGMVSACAYSGAYPTGYGSFDLNTEGIPDRLWEDARASGFTHFQQSGTGAIRKYYNYFRVTPMLSALDALGVSWALSDERAEPGYYAARLNAVDPQQPESSIDCEITVGPKSAVHRYTFGEHPDARLVIDFSHGGLAIPHGETVPLRAQLEMVGPGMVRGEVVVEGVPLAVHIECDTPGWRQLLWYDKRLMHGGTRLDFEALLQRVHPAASRVTLLAEQTPARLVVWDVLALGDDDLTGLPFADRRARLELVVGGSSGAVSLTPQTDDLAVARRWFGEFEGAGLDGVVAKPLDDPYAPGKRTLIKIKHARTADVVALGYRVHKSGSGVGSLLVGLYDDTGVLRQVGGVAAWTDAMRQKLVDELAPLVERDESGDVVTGEGERSRFTGAKDVSFVRLRPERVLEVRYDQLEGARFRHTVQFARWRPDRDAASCTYAQLDTVAGYDLADVLT